MNQIIQAMRMIHHRHVAIIAVGMLLIAGAGCGSSPDERIAQAAKQLVERDAEARRELIAAHSKLASELSSQRAMIQAGQQQLEQERREFAQQRHRDPIIAAAIVNVGLLIACLLPLIIALYLIGKMQTQEPDHAAVAELLTTELTSENPRLLPEPQRRHQRLTHADEDDREALG